MKNGIIRRALPVLLTLAQLGPLASAQTPAHSLRDLSFLKGSWYGNGKGGSYIEEYWSGAEGDSILGNCRFIQNGKTTFYELLAVVILPEGIVLRMRHFNEAFAPWSEKNEAGDCPMVSCTKDEAIFDNNNKEHDVKVTYRRTGPKSLSATVAVTRDGKTSTYTFQYTLTDSETK